MRIALCNSLAKCLVGEDLGGDKDQMQSIPDKFPHFKVQPALLRKCFASDFLNGWHPNWDSNLTLLDPLCRFFVDLWSSPTMKALFFRKKDCTKMLH